MDLPSLPVRLVKVFVSPADLFDRLREKPAWAGALAVAIAIMAVAVVLIPVEIWGEAARAELAGMEGGAGGEMEGAPEWVTSGSMARWAAVGGVIIGTPLAAAVFAGVLLVVFNFVLAREISYRQYFAVVCHAYVIPAVGYLATTPIRVVARRPELGLSVGLFTEPVLSGGFLQRAMESLDLFGVWAWVVVALGVSRLDTRQGWGAAVAVLLVLKLVQAALIGAAAGLAPGG